MELAYRHLGGTATATARLVHSHPHAGPHTHEQAAHSHAHGEHGHSHGLLDPTIKRSRAGVRAVLLSLLVLGLAALAQLAIFR